MVVKQVIDDKLNLCAKLNTATFNGVCLFVLATLSIDLSSLIDTQYLLPAKRLGNSRPETCLMIFINHFLNSFPKALA